MSVALTVMVIYMVFIIGLAVLVTKRQKKKDTKAYLLAGQSLPWYLVAVMVTGIAVGGASTVGVAEQAYTAGLSASWYTIAWSCAALVFGLLISNKIRKYNIITVSGLINQIFGKRDGLIASLMQILLMFGINAAQIVAGGAILSSLMPEIFDMQLGMIVSTLVYIAISFFGGYLGASVTNFVNVIVIYVGLILGVVYSVYHFGGWQVINTTLPAGDHWYNMVSGVGPAVIVGWIVTMILTAPPNQTLFQVSAAAQNEKSASKGFIVAAVLMAFPGVLAALIGIIAASQLQGLESAAMALPTLAMTFPPVVSGIMLSGLWAADVSTAIGLLLGVSTIITRDIVVANSQKTLSDQQQIVISKIILVAIAVLSLLVALGVESIIDFLMQLMTLYTPYALIILAVFYCPKLLRKSTCIATVLAGAVVMVLWAVVPTLAQTISAIYVTLPLCSIVMLLCYLFDKREMDVTKRLEGQTE